MELSLKVTSQRLGMEGWQGRRTLYVSVTLGSRTWWLQRWDAPRSGHHRIVGYSRDRKMAYTVGAR